MTHQCVGPAADQFMVLLDRHRRAPVTAQAGARPAAEGHADGGQQRADPEIRVVRRQEALE